jgi:hypothetical protein
LVDLVEGARMETERVTGESSRLQEIAESLGAKLQETEAALQAAEANAASLGVASNDAAADAVSRAERAEAALAAAEARAAEAERDAETFAKRADDADGAQARLTRVVAELDAARQECATLAGAVAAAREEASQGAANAAARSDTELATRKIELDEARAEAAALREELVMTQQARDAALANTLPTSSSAAAPGEVSLTIGHGKKDEDGEMDIEGAIMTGGDQNFRPLLGRVKALSWAPARENKHFQTVAGHLDKMSVYLQRRPLLRLGLLLYIILVHLMWLL